ncbi:MAG: transcriptional repressor LexA [Vulcanimicrobiota bacterium]
MSKKQERREKVFQYTYDRLIKGDPPSIREVQKAVGFRAVESARIHLDALVKEGRLVKKDGNSRAYALPPEVWAQHTCRGVPVLGQVQAGSLTLALEEVEGYVPTSRTRPGEKLFALRVKGMSMQGGGILPGDLVIVRRQESADNGDIVIAIVDDEATVKRFKRKGEKVYLLPENEEFEPIVFENPQEELKLLGKVLEVRRYYENP